MASPAHRRPPHRLRRDHASAARGIDVQAIAEATLDVIIRCRDDGIASCGSWYPSP